MMSANLGDAMRWVTIATEFTSLAFVFTYAMWHVDRDTMVPPPDLRRRVVTTGGSVLTAGVFVVWTNYLLGLLP